MNTGRRLVASLVTHHAHAPTENLQFSQGKIHNHTHRTKRKRLQTWRLGTWNVRSMIDTIGCIEIASRRQDGQRGEDRTERGKPIKEQQGAVKCNLCKNTFGVKKCGQVK